MDTLDDQQAADFDGENFDETEKSLTMEEFLEGVQLFLNVFCWGGRGKEFKFFLGKMTFP